VDEVDEDVQKPESPEEAAHNAPLRRFRLGRYVLMLLFAAVAAACVAPAVTSLVIAADSSGGAEVNLRRMTEGGSPVTGPMVAYGTILLIAVVCVGLFAAAGLAAVLLLRKGIHAAAWAVLAVAGVAGAVATLVALTQDTAEVRMLLTFLLCGYAALTVVSLFELWRARWVRRQWAAAALVGAASPATTRGV
jgi:hypothetical protein